MLQSFSCRGPVFIQFITDNILGITWKHRERHLTCLIIHFILSSALEVLISKQGPFLATLTHMPTCGSRRRLNFKHFLSIHQAN